MADIKSLKIYNVFPHMASKEFVDEVLAGTRPEHMFNFFDFYRRFDDLVSSMRLASEYSADRLAEVNMEFSPAFAESEFRSYFPHLSKSPVEGSSFVGRLLLGGPKIHHWRLEDLDYSNLLKEMHRRREKLSARMPNNYYAMVALQARIENVRNLGGKIWMENMLYSGPLEAIAIDTKNKTIFKKKPKEDIVKSEYDSIDGVLDGLRDELGELVEQRRGEIEEYASGIKVVTKPIGKDSLAFQIKGW